MLIFDVGAGRSSAVLASGTVGSSLLSTAASFRDGRLPLVLEEEGAAVDPLVGGRGGVLRHQLAAPMLPGWGRGRRERRAVAAVRRRGQGRGSADAELNLNSYHVLVPAP